MKNLAERVVNKMYDNDHFSKWLGIEIQEINEGNCTLSMVVRDEMLNGFGIAHGSITYALADSALAFASNSHGRKSVSIETSISHLLPCKKGDQLIANAVEINRSNKLGVYNIEVRNKQNDLVASFKGTVYRTHEDWF